MDDNRPWEERFEDLSSNPQAWNAFEQSIITQPKWQEGKEHFRDAARAMADAVSVALDMPFDVTMRLLLTPDVWNTLAANLRRDFFGPEANDN